MKQLLKNKFAYLLKFSIGIILIILILSRVDRQKALEYFLSINFSTLIPILILSVITISIQFLRWRYLVSSNSDDFEMKDILPSFFAGYAFRLMIPGGHAEVSKIFLLPGKKRGKAVAFGMEKFFQTYIKLVLIIFVLPISFPEYQTLFYVILFTLILVLFLIPKIGWLKFLQEKEVNNTKIFINTLMYSLGIFLIMSAQYYILLNRVHEIHFLDTMHTVVYLWGSGIIPISISGLGVREGLAVYFLNFYGISSAFAVATSLFLFTLNTVTPALFGIYFIYKKRSNLKEMKHTVKSTRYLWNELRNPKNHKRKNDPL